METSKGKYWLGVDPGGMNAFGVACLYESGECETACVSCADEAVSLVTTPPLGVGVDAPLWWSSGKSGGRKADKWIRNKHKIKPGTVQEANSLRGAALVQGVMFVQRLREKFGAVNVTEAHPKAVAIALGGWDGEHVSSLIPQAAQSESEHARDAIMSAITAREGFSRRWTLDLSTSRYESEQDPQTYWLAPVHYYWPDL